MIKKTTILCALLFLTACSGPRIGKDIIINIDKNSVHLENSKMDIVLEGLALVGLPVEHTVVELSADLNVINKWHSNIRLKKLTYNLVTDNEIIAKGGATIDSLEGLAVESDSSIKIPLILKIDPKNISVSKTITRVIKQKEFYIQGIVVTSVYGKEFTHTFNKNIKDLQPKHAQR